MKGFTRKLGISILMITLLLTFCSCHVMGNTKKDYSSYVQAVMDLNYKADYEQYLAITGVEEAQAIEVYNEGITNLANQLMTIYGVQPVEGTDLDSQFEELARNIYSCAKYEITDVNKVDGVYTVTVAIQPIDIISATYEDVSTYIEDMNDKVAQGVYDDYELSDYQLEYAEGIIRILNNALPNVTYSDEVSVTVSILDNGEYYYISDMDFLALDKPIINFESMNAES